MATATMEKDATTLEQAVRESEAAQEARYEHEAAPGLYGLVVVHIDFVDEVIEHVIAHCIIVKVRVSEPLEVSLYGVLVF